MKKKDAFREFVEKYGKTEVEESVAHEMVETNSDKRKVYILRKDILCHAPDDVLIKFLEQDLGAELEEMVGR